MLNFALNNQKGVKFWFFINRIFLLESVNCFSFFSTFLLDVTSGSRIIRIHFSERPAKFIASRVQVNASLQPFKHKYVQRGNLKNTSFNSFQHVSRRNFIFLASLKSTPLQKSCRWEKIKNSSIFA